MPLTPIGSGGLTVIGGAGRTGLRSIGRRRATVDQLVAPIYAAHRGGKNVYPEHTIEGYRAAAADGFLPELDIQVLSDGTLVPIHDTTVTRTMTGITGNVSAATLSTWKAATVVNPSVPGSQGFTPPTWTEVLDEFGGRTVLMPESKVAGALTPLINSVTSRNLHRSVIMQAGSYADAQTMVAAGICTGLISDTIGTGGANPTAAQVAAAGIEYVIVSTSVNEAYCDALTALGVKVLVHSVSTRAQATTFSAYPVSGYISDDPWHMTGTGWPISTTDSYASKILWPRWTDQGQTNFEFSGTNEFGVGHAGAAGASGVWWHSDLGTVGPRFKVGWRQKFAPTTTTALTGFGGIFVGVVPTTDFIFTDLSHNVGQNGYYAFCRRNGDRTLMRIDNAAQVTIGTNTTDPDIAINTDTAYNDLELEVNGTQVIFRNLTASGSTAITVSDTTYRPSAAKVFFKVSTQHALMSNVTVTALP